MDASDAGIAVGEDRTGVFGVLIGSVGLSLVLTGVLLVFAGLVWGHSGYDILLIGIGWPHIMLGLVGHGIKLRNGDVSRLFFPAGIALWSLISWLHHEFLLLAFIQILFVFHAVRDEISIYLRRRIGKEPAPVVSDIPGMLPFLLLLLLIPDWSVTDDAARYDLRDSTRSGGLIGFNASEPRWTLFPFAPVLNCEGHQFRFWVEARNSESFPEMLAALTPSSKAFLVNGRLSVQAVDGTPLALNMAPRYGAELGLPGTPPPADHATARVSGGHRLEQSFVAEQDELSGIWVWIDDSKSRHKPLNLHYGLQSASLVPATFPRRALRITLIVILGLVGIRQIARSPWTNLGAWTFLAAMAALFMVPVIFLIRQSGLAGGFPYLFQFLVVFHYISWYVFALRHGANSARRTPAWVIFTVLLNAVFIGIAWLHYSGRLPTYLSVPFRIEYFAYALLFHVCMSFGHRRAKAGPHSPWTLLN